jgi:hypothetical protein
MNSRMRTSALGLAAPVVYGVTVVLGGVLWPGYSHLRDPISLLESVGAPNAPLMHVLFGAYNVLLLLFGVGWRSGQRLSSRLAKLAAILLSMIGLLGLVMYFFPQDAIGTNVIPTCVGPDSFGIPKGGQIMIHRGKREVCHGERDRTSQGL